MAGEARFSGHALNPPPAPSAVEEPSDVDLARRLRNADTAALSQLYRRFGRPCYSLARCICADDALAEDVVLEVFLALWREPLCLDPARGSIATLLLTLTHRTAIDAARKAGTAHQGPVAAHDAGQERIPVRDADQREVVRPAADQVRAALDRLPGEQRQVLAGAYFGGQTLREIAAFTGVPLSTVKSRLWAGVLRLRSLLTARLDPDTLMAEVRIVGKAS